MPILPTARRLRKNGAPGSINAAAGDMRYGHFPRYLCLSALAGILLAWPWSETSFPPRESIAGVVRDDNGPMAGVRVRLQQSSESTLTDRQGQFRLPGTVQPGLRVTAWKAGYFIGGAAGDSSPLVIRLRSLPRNDCEDYVWVSS